MSAEAITKFDTPWRVVRLGGTDHIPEHDVDFVFDVVDAKGSIICETADEEVAKAITELPNLFHRLKAIAQSEPAIICHIGGEDVECPRCDSLIRGGKDIINRLGVKV